MIIYAITFMTERACESRLIDWLRTSAIPALEIPADSKTRLTKVAAVPGDPEFSRQALSMTLHVEFASPAPARAWAEKALDSVLDEFSRKFGQNALHFVSVLKTIDL